MPERSHTISEIPTVSQPVAVDVHDEDGSEFFRGKTILIVDDAPTTIKVLSRWMSKFGCEIVTARDGQEGLAKMKDLRDRLRFVIMDADACDGWLRIYLAVQGVRKVDWRRERIGNSCIVCRTVQGGFRCILFHLETFWSI